MNSPQVDIKSDEDSSAEAEGVLYQATVDFQNRHNADIFVVSGAISRALADEVVLSVQFLSERRPNAIVFLCTYGGDADAAYVIAKTFQNCYERFMLYIPGYCKSAGTLIALGADEIVISAIGELGPLDVQLVRDDNFAVYTSGQDVYRALSAIQEQAFSIFESTFLQLIGKSGGSITTRTAANIATELAVGLLAPITAHLDPLKIGETERAMAIAYDYGVRLGANPDCVVRLIYDYPSHSFVIDVDEAKELFKSVRGYDQLEYLVEICVTKTLLKSGQCKSLRTPHPDGIVVFLEIEPEVSKKKGDANDNKTQQDAEQNQPTRSGNGSGRKKRKNSNRAESK